MFEDCYEMHETLRDMNFSLCLSRGEDLQIHEVKKPEPCCKNKIIINDGGINVCKSCGQIKNYSDAYEDINFSKIYLKFVENLFIKENIISEKLFMIL